ncbi:MAG: hypothetical protein [Caudoviricetes sp.]|nr:MAG: hypothetical protein [Caudoviricetes sp.]
MQSLKRMLLKLKFLGFIKLVITYLAIPALGFLTIWSCIYLCLNTYLANRKSALLLLLFLIGAVAIAIIDILINCLFDFIWKQYDKCLTSYLNACKKSSTASANSAIDYDNWLIKVTHLDGLIIFGIWAIISLVSLIFICGMVYAGGNISDNTLMFFISFWVCIIPIIELGEDKWEF